MTDAEMDGIAERVASKMGAYNPPQCSISIEEQSAIRDLIKTKKRAVNASLGLVGLLIAWVLRDAYLWIVGHLAIQ